MASFGETLRRERELREISLRDIADATKINIRYLEALERNRFEILPGGVFNKGFIRAYARFIGADGEALVDGYLQELAAREAASAPAAPRAAPTAAAPAAPLQPGLLRPAENPLRRIVETRDAARRPDPPAPAPSGVALAETIPGAGGAAAIPILTAAGVGVPADVPAAPEISSTPDHRRFMPVMTASGAAAVLLILFVAARSFRGSSAPAHGPAGEPMAAQDSAAVEPAAQDTAAQDSDAQIAAARGSAPQEGAAPRPAPEVATAHGPMVSPAARDATEPPQARAEAPSRPPARRAAPGPVPPAPDNDARPPVVTPPAQAAESATVPGAPAQASNGMEFRVEAASPVWVQVACDGEDRINRSLQGGEGQTLRCLSLVRVSATDAGAVRLFVNGVRCVPIGDPGTRVEGFAIHSDDFRAICPPGGAAGDGRR